MAYTLNAFVATLPVLERFRQDFPAFKVVALKQKLGLIPLTAEISQSLWDQAPPFGSVVFQRLPQALTDYAARASQAGYLAYVEADYFGGAGHQAAVIWKDGQRERGPFLAYRLPLSDMPINYALRLLGVTIYQALDEFETVGLNAYRHTEDWLNAR
jgi:hypothetical protein